MLVSLTMLQCRALYVTIRSEVTRVYYVVWWAGRWLSSVDDSPPSSLNTSLESNNLDSYGGAEQNLARVRSVLVRGRVLSAGSVDDLLAAIQQAWLSVNSSVEI